MASNPHYAPVPVSEKDMLEEPFLPHDESGEVCRGCRARTQRRTSWLRRVILHVCVAAVYMSILGGLWAAYAPQSRHPVDIHAYPPAQEALVYRETHFETSYENNPYAGEPRPEHEETWNNLLRNPSIRVTGDELEQLNLTSLRLKSGGYVAQLGVFHQLHCVKWIRQWMHREHYWPELHGVMLEERRRHIGKSNRSMHEYSLTMPGHADHCLEMFRFHFQCHPDISLGTYKWFGSHPTPGLVHRAQCADWDALVDWKNERSVSLRTLDDLADRPPTESWEPSLKVILGQSKGEPGEVDRYSQALVDAEPPLIKALYEAPTDGDLA